MWRVTPETDDMPARSSERERERDMVIMVIGALVLLSGYLGLRLKEARTEILTLRASLASLRRQFVRMT